MCLHLHPPGIHFHAIICSVTVRSLGSSRTRFLSTGIGLITVVVLACMAKEAPNVVPTTATPVYGHNTAVYQGHVIYPVATPGRPLQPPVVASTASGANQGHLPQNAVNASKQAANDSAQQYPSQP